jgi:hypothetical protein
MTDYKKIYYDVKNPEGFVGASALIRNTKRPKKEVNDWLQSQEAYTLHAPIRKNFKRNFYKVSKIDETWQADLVDMQKYSKENKNYKYILTVIDIFSKFAFAEPLKSKNGSSLRNAFKRIFRLRKPIYLMTDKGREFNNKIMHDFYIKHKVKFYTAKNPDIKASVCERFNRTLKSRMWRYFTYKNSTVYSDVLQDLITAYNNSYHRSIRMTPMQVTKENSDLVWRNLYRGKYHKFQNAKYTIGDYVRISKQKATFEKGFERNYTQEIFKIINVLPRMMVLYEIEDLSGEKIDGRFYEKELIKVNLPEMYKINKIISSKGKGVNRKLLVSWLGYPKKFNSWINSTDLQ